MKTIVECLDKIIPKDRMEMIAFCNGAFLFITIVLFVNHFIF